MNPATRIERKIAQARFVLLVERIWPLCWPPLAVAGAFLMFSLWDGWAWLSPLAHRVALGAFAVALLAALVPLLRVAMPTRGEALRRMETRSGLPHRPASAYEDQLAATGASEATAAIWAAHRSRLAALSNLFRAGRPAPRTDARDPFATRAVLVLALVATAFAYRGGIADKLAAAVTPKPAHSAQDMRLDGWITPPAFTGRAPIMLADGRAPAAGDEEGGALIAPEGSTLTLRVNHPAAASFRMTVAAEGREEAIAPAAAATAADTFAELRTTLRQSATVSLVEGGSVYARWALTIEADNAPTIALNEPPSRTTRGALRLKYRAEDDHGVATANAALALAAEPGSEPPLGEAPAFGLPLAKANAKAAEGQTYRDLQPHPWAGLPVELALTATDQAGQVGAGQAVTFILPERDFKHPLAREIITQRKRLVAEPNAREQVAGGIDQLVGKPAEAGVPAGVYLGLRSAYWRLLNDNVGRDGLMTVVEQLWAIAISLEDGALSDAEKELRAAQEKLQNALDNNASDDEIKQAMDELRAALDKFMAAMAQQEQQPGKPQDSEQRSVSSKELREMLDKIEELAKTGSKDAAKQMLAELQEMLENAQKQQQGGQSEAAKQRTEQMNKLGDMMREQKRLMDETFRKQAEEMDGGAQGKPQESGRQKALDSQRMRGQRGQNQPGQQSQGEGEQDGAGNSFQSLKQRQEQLKQQLETLAKELAEQGGEGAGKLGEAGKAMSDAESALGQSDAGEASAQQGRALDNMRQTAREMAEGEGRQPGGQQQRGEGAGRDPLGRPMPQQQFDPGSSVRVPDEIDVQKARHILDELRRRSGERLRPADELEYIERLIQR